MFDDTNKLSILIYTVIGTLAMFRVLIYTGLRERIVYGSISGIFYLIAIYYVYKYLKDNHKI
ncbi:MAG: hypothetical protein J6P61_07720 [Erysipelotrichaceae bacterium]|nr:hypothetical protein [Erysipelotrichaceae bacterium]